MDLTTPILKCKKCKSVIPNNDMPKVGGVPRRIGLLGCEHCAKEASPPRAPKKYPLRNGERQEGQDNFLDECPSILVGRDHEVVQ